MSNIVEIKNLSKNYNKKEVLKNININIAEGQIIGLFGPNGSGKTTLLKTLAGLLKEYSGEIKIGGENIGVYTKSIVSYLPEKTYFHKNMTAQDAISIFSDFYTDFNVDKAKSMLKELSLSETQRIGTMSKGMQEKLQLIMVMAREARLYLLDEPLGGVDPASRDYILDTIIKNYNEKSSILLSTHLIHDVERIFDKAIFIKDGNIVLNEYVDVIRDEKGMSIDKLFREVYK